MAKLKIAGTWSGDLQVELEQWTVPMLREEVAKQSSMLPETVNLICAGKVLKDGDGSEKLSQLGIKNNAKILATRVSADEGKSLVAEEERSRRLTRVKAAAAALVERHADGSLPLEDFNIELEDQNGETIRFGTETDRRAMMMGLMLHANAKKLIRRQLYKDALEVLTMGEHFGFRFIIGYLLLSDLISTHVIRYSKFQSVANITLYFPENFGGDTTQIHFIGLKGEATQLKRDVVATIVYEITPNPSDHKTKAEHGGGLSHVE